MKVWKSERTMAREKRCKNIQSIRKARIYHLWFAGENSFFKVLDAACLQKKKKKQEAMTSRKILSKKTKISANFITPALWSIPLEVGYLSIPPFKSTPSLLMSNGPKENVNKALKTPFCSVFVTNYEAVFVSWIVTNERKYKYKKTDCGISNTHFQTCYN